MALRPRMLSISCLSAGAWLVAALVPAYAGLPRGAMLVADEQDADPETGVTIARGNAEITVDKQRIVGRADTIELRPATKDIVFKGRARVTVGASVYEGDAVTCVSDFSRCVSGETASQTQAAAAGDQMPAAAVTPAETNQGLQQPSALGAGAAATNPR